MRDDDVIQDIKNRLKLSQVIGTHVKLQHRGKSVVGLCPFHNEKTPSFNVNDARGFYHCFGCGAHGDHFTFVQEIEKLTFPDALKKLAHAAGVTLPERSPERAAEAARAQGLRQVLESAQTFFQIQLNNPAGRDAQQYLQERGLSSETIKQFGLGFALNSWDALKAHLSKLKFDDEQMLAVGLVVQKRDDMNRKYDMFRDRITFPIHDERGQLIGFGARATKADQQPKYINSPETALFHKSKTLYGLHLAKNHLSTSQPLMFVEGYMDVIALHQAGFKQAVAPLGTALTEDHLRVAWRLSQTPIICFDGDAAGLRASNRAIDLALPQITGEQSLRFLTLPDQHDPDSYIQAHGAEAWATMVSSAKSMIDQLWHNELQLKALMTPEDKAGLKKRILQRLDLIADTTLRALYRDDLLQRWQQTVSATGVATTAKILSNRRFDRRQPTMPVINTGGLKAPAGADQYRAGLLLAVINHPAILDDVCEELAQIVHHAAALNALQSDILECVSTDINDNVLNDLMKKHSAASALLTDSNLLLRCKWAQKGQQLNLVKQQWLDVYKTLKSMSSASMSGKPSGFHF